MSEIETLIINKLDKVEEHLDDIKVTLVRNTADLEYHIKRTDMLQDTVSNLNKLVEPIYHERLSSEAIAQQKKASQAALMYKLKLLAAIITTLGTIIGTVTLLTRK